ncbi:MAG: type IV secretory system conjugative DNA transfer family protein [Ruminococcus sp.]|nr:type IV secretory system conjugative DNA transfer family protein [Ruminococcus sp.]
MYSNDETFDDYKARLEYEALLEGVPLPDDFFEKFDIYDYSDETDESYEADNGYNEDYEQDFRDGEFIFAKGVSRSLDDRITRLNNNVLVVGASGCGKSTGFVEPNLVTAKGSYVISDPKGTLYRKYANYLHSKGYDVLKIDFQNPENSMRWNPLTEIQSTQDIMKIANSLVYDKVVNSYNFDPFWDRMTLIFICAIIGYMYETGYKPYNFSSILQLVREGERKEEIINKGRNSRASELFKRFQKLHEMNPNSWAYEQFKSVDQAPDKTYDTIRSTLVSKFSNYNTEEIEKMMLGNDCDFKKIAQKKTALFVQQSDYDRSMDGLVNLFFSQAMSALVKYADLCENGRLPVPVRFFLDDYGATTNIYNLDAVISTIRSRNISVSLILQSESQLMKNSARTDKTIISNCDTYIYMGSNDIETAKSVSIRCNKPLENVLYMPISHCWVFTRGKKPVYAEISDRPILKEYDLIYSSPEILADEFSVI